jgi:hypothetical protein
MDRYNVYLKQTQLVELKNFLLDCARTLRENKKNKILLDWLNEKGSSFDEEQRMRVNSCQTEVCIRAPLNVMSTAPIGQTTLVVYLGLEAINYFVRDIKDALLEIRLEEKAKKSVTT